MEPYTLQLDFQACPLPDPQIETNSVLVWLDWQEGEVWHLHPNKMRNCWEDFRREDRWTCDMGQIAEGETFPREHEFRWAYWPADVSAKWSKT